MYNVHDVEVSILLRSQVFWNWATDSAQTKAKILVSCFYRYSQADSKFIQKQKDIN